MQGSDGVRWFNLPYEMTPTGLEHSEKTQGIKATDSILPPQSPPSGAINELLALWSALDESARRDLLAVARGLAQAVTERSR